MKLLPNLQRRKLHLNYWDQNSKTWDALKAEIESQLRLMYLCETRKVTSLDANDFYPCDLLVIYYHPPEGIDIVIDLKNLEKKVRTHEKIWIPCLLIGTIKKEDYIDVFEFIKNSNWYFDLVDPAHVSSLPIRVSNLLRMHDHLHELRRYDNELTKLEKSLVSLVGKLPESKEGTDPIDDS